jgi:hypothetical protein
VEVTAFLNDLIARVSGQVSDPATRDALLARLRAALATFAGGGRVDDATMQALLRDVGAALGRRPGSDEHHEATNAPSSSVTTAEPEHHEAPPTTANGGTKAGVLRLLDAAAAKVQASSLDDATKNDLLARIGAVRAKVAAGTPLEKEELGQLLTSVRDAVEGDGPEAHAPTSSSSSTPRPDAGRRAAEMLQRQIDKVQASDLPDDVKAKVLAALQDALAAVTSGGGGGAGAPAGTDDVRTALVAKKEAKLEELRNKLKAVLDELNGAVDAAAAKGLDPATAQSLKDALAKAGDALALATTAQDLRAVHTQLRDVRLALTKATTGA